MYKVCLIRFCDFMSRELLVSVRVRVCFVCSACGQIPIIVRAFAARCLKTTSIWSSGAKNIR